MIVKWGMCFLLFSLCLIGLRNKIIMVKHWSVLDWVCWILLHVYIIIIIRFSYYFICRLWNVGRLLYTVHIIKYKNIKMYYYKIPYLYLFLLLFVWSCIFNLKININRRITQITDTTDTTAKTAITITPLSVPLLWLIPLSTELDSCGDSTAMQKC